ncbi:MAG: hypothetical protein LBV28_01990 [Puniceicoccales bacterium]|jgi:hypothetical protein|nr:hypothetical protein [Puniceicoccales bacterium]
MTDDAHDDSLDKRIDALFAKQPAPVVRADFADAVLRSLQAEDNATDALVDERLRHLPLLTRAERTEKLFHGVLRTLHFQKLIRWSIPAAAALLAGIVALPVFLAPTQNRRAAALPAEEVVARAMADDPALAAMLRSSNTVETPSTLDTETIDLIAGLNDNAIAWLETLTYYEN